MFPPSVHTILCIAGKGGFLIRRHFLLASMVALAVAVSAFGYARAQRGPENVARRPAPVLPPLRGGPERGQRPPAQLHLEAQRTYPGQVFAHASRQEPEVALTFDDGPDSVYTPQILDILKRKGVRATFYFTGRRIETYPDVAKRAVREGHEIGNHTYDHPDLAKATPEEILAQLQRTEEIIERVTGRRPLTFRPPYGKHTPEVVAGARKLGYRIILWDVDSLDWESLIKDQIVENVVPKVQPGAIILFHSAAGGPGEDLSGAVQALPQVIDKIKDRKLKQVNVTEMFGIIRTRE